MNNKKYISIISGILLFLNLCNIYSFAEEKSDKSTQTLLINNFNSIKIGSIPGPTIDTNEKSSIIVIKNSDSLYEDDRCVKFAADKQKSNPAFIQCTKNTKGANVIQLKIKIENEHQNININLFDDSLIQRKVLSFLSDGKIYSNGQSLCEYKIDIWYTVDLMVDFSTLKFDLSLNNKVIKQGGDFPNTFDDKSINWKNGCNGIGFELIGEESKSLSFLLDDIRIYTGNEILSDYDLLSDEQKAMYNLRDSVAMFIGSNNALVKSEVKQIDEDAEIVPLIVEGKTLLPVRFVAESLGSTVTWDEERKCVIIKNDSKIIELKIDDTKMLVDGIKIDIDVPAKIINSKTYVPFRSIAEALDKKILWDDRGLIVLCDDENVIPQADYNLTDKVIEKISARIYARNLNNEAFEIIRDTRNLNPHKIVSTMASNFNASREPELSIDNDLSSKWTTLGKGNWITYDLGEMKSINCISMAWGYGNDGNNMFFDIQMSDDGINWVDVLKDKKSSGCTIERTVYRFDSVDARYIKYIANGNTSDDFVHLSEFNAYSN